MVDRPFARAERWRQQVGLALLPRQAPCGENDHLGIAQSDTNASVASFLLGRTLERFYEIVQYGDVVPSQPLRRHAVRERPADGYGAKSCRQGPSIELGIGLVQQTGGSVTVIPRHPRIALVQAEQADKEMRFDIPRFQNVGAVLIYDSPELG